MSDIATRAIEDNTGVLRTITVCGEYDGFHKWEDAPEEVAFLRHNHRHLFKWKAEIEVFHDDRELEFFMVKAAINREILPFVTQMYNLGSCEQQAERILKGLINTYGADRAIDVTVSEDGENSATIYYPSP